MLGAEFTALINSAGIMNTSAFTLVCRSAKSFLIFIRRVLEERYGHANKNCQNSQDEFHNAPHFVFLTNVMEKLERKVQKARVQVLRKYIPTK